MTNMNLKNDFSTQTIRIPLKLMSKYCFLAWLLQQNRRLKTS